MNNSIGENSFEKNYSAMNIPYDSFKFINAKSEQLYKILVNIGRNKSYDIGEIPKMVGGCLQKHCVKSLCNLTLSSEFPLMCNTAKMKPLHKLGTYTEPKNDRPVSLRVIFIQDYRKSRI